MKMQSDETIVSKALDWAVAPCSLLEPRIGNQALEAAVERGCGYTTWRAGTVSVVMIERGAAMAIGTDTDHWKAVSQALVSAAKAGLLRGACRRRGRAA